MRRRNLIALAGGAMVMPCAVRAEQRGKMAHIGYLGSGTAVSLLLDAFRQGLADLGFIEGQNIAIDYRFAEGSDDRLAGLAAELVLLKVDVIVASPTPAAMAAKNTSTTTPIVGIGLDNPVEHGLVASLAHPGGNITGVSYSVGPEIFGKDLELLRDLAPEIQRVAVLSNSGNPNHQPMIDNLRHAARSLGLELLVLDAHGPDEFDAAFAKMGESRVGALFVFGDPMFAVHRTRLAELAAKNQLPSMHTNRLHVEAGGLICYGPSFIDLWRRGAGYVGKILRGAKPADLPVEQPTKFELVINLKTAKALRLTVPQSLLARADEVIE